MVMQLFFNILLVYTKPLLVTFPRQRKVNFDVTEREAI